MQLHGGDWAGYVAEYGAMPLDFSANVSPLGLPEGVRAAAIRALDMADRYPDPQCRELRRRLSEALGLPAAWICCGGGAADLIFRLTLARRPRRAMVTAPAFLEYEQALNAVGCRVERVPLLPEENFALSPALPERLSPDLDMLFLCQPGNPTGVTIPRSLLLELLERCREMDILLVLDECFVELLEDMEAYSLVDEVADYDNLAVLRAFTKCYAMAGLRLGYCLSGNGPLLEAVARCGQPWSVSGVAQAAGAAALEEREYLKRLRSLVARERPLLLEGLSALGCRVIPGKANFLLFSHRDTALAEKLRARGILIRDCANYPGLGRGWYRVAVRTGAENRILLHTMEEVLL